MGLLDEKKVIENKLKFYLKDSAEKELAAYIDDMDGTLRIAQEKFNSIYKCKQLCQWYLSICDNL